MPSSAVLAEKRALSRNEVADALGLTFSTAKPGELLDNVDIWATLAELSKRIAAQGKAPRKAKASKQG